MKTDIPGNMPKRFVSIWFPHLETDWFSLRRPELNKQSFVLASPDHGRMVIKHANQLAQTNGIYSGMVVADARALLPSLQVIDNKPGLSTTLLNGIAKWCIRFTPAVAVDEPDGLILEATGCAHLWGGEKAYLTDIITRLNNLHYTVRAAIADTIGAAWALARFSQDNPIAGNGEQSTALLPFPAEALRVEPQLVERLYKLGLRQLNQFIGMPRSTLRRRFGPGFLKRLDQALGHEEEIIQPVQPVIPYQERLVCPEPIITRTGIEIALQQLLGTLCDRLMQEEKGLRKVVFKCYRADGKVEMTEISTNRPSANAAHLFKLFEFRLDDIGPGPGIELFQLDGILVETNPPVPTTIWNRNAGLDDIELSELLDRVGIRIGPEHIHRYLPDEHYWPERSVKLAISPGEKKTTPWKADRPRPLQLLTNPELIEVTVPIPDYPPMLFRYKGILHKITRADGPERIEQEWWIQQGQLRDYYTVEDEEGYRYWLFRLGHYSEEKKYQWYIHGFFA